MPPRLLRGRCCASCVAARNHSCNHLSMVCLARLFGRQRLRCPSPWCFLAPCSAGSAAALDSGVEDADLAKTAFNFCMAAPNVRGPVLVLAAIYGLRVEGLSRVRARLVTTPQGDARSAFSRITRA